MLSVAAQQIYIVLTAKKDRKKQFIFSDGDVVDLNPEFGIFLTMVSSYNRPEYVLSHIINISFHLTLTPVALCRNHLSHFVQIFVEI